MTKDTNKKNALKVIRYIQENVEGLTITHWSNGGKTAGVEYLQPQLNHLLLAINKKEYLADFYTEPDGDTWISGLSKDYQSEFQFTYDLTKTVEENLKSNPELCQYLLDLFQLTTNN